MRRFIRLTNLIPEVLDMVDEKKISMTPAVELSYLTPEEQRSFLEAMDYAQAAPSVSQAQRMKKKSQEGGCTLDDMCGIMDEVKKDDLGQVAFKTSDLQKYFPKSYTPKQMSDTILRLLNSGRGGGSGTRRDDTPINGRIFYEQKGVYAHGQHSFPFQR